MVQDNCWGILSSSRENRDFEGRKRHPVELIKRCLFCLLKISLVQKVGVFFVLIIYRLSCLSSHIFTIAYFYYSCLLEGVETYRINRVLFGSVEARNSVPFKMSIERRQIMLSSKARALGLLFVLCLIGSCATTTVKEEKPSASVEVHSVWQGTFDQFGWQAYPMILFISWRVGDAFEGMTWYPTVGNGLLTISGQIKPDGVITFTEEEVIQGSTRGVLSGGRYTASLEGNILEGPSFHDNIEVGHFVLKLAD